MKKLFTSFLLGCSLFALEAHCQPVNSETSDPSESQESSLPADFRGDLYVAMYPDLQAHVRMYQIEDVEAWAGRHYLRHGKREGRKYRPSESAIAAVTPSQARSRMPDDDNNNRGMASDDNNNRSSSHDGSRAAASARTAGANLQEDLRHLRSVRKDTLPDLLSAAERGNNDALDQLLAYHNSLESLSSHGYVPNTPPSGTDKKIGHIQRFFREHEIPATSRMKSTSKTHSTPRASAPFDVVPNQTWGVRTARDRTDVFNQNQIVTKNGYQMNGSTHHLNTHLGIKGVRVYGNVDDPFVKPIGTSTPKYQQTETYVEDADTLDCALKMISAGRNPLVFDMANAKLPGGACTNGRGAAQEEQIVYRSDLYAQLHHIETQAHLGRGGNFIPKEGGIYLPLVTIFRESASRGYAFMDTPETISIGAIAAYRHKSRPAHKTKDETIYPELKDEKTYWQSTANKLRAFFEMGIENGHDSLLLSAFGCGAFANPPKTMARVIEDVVDEYAGCFKEIRFGIFARGNPRDKNLQVFHQKFHGKSFSPRDSEDERF